MILVRPFIGTGADQRKLDRVMEDVSGVFIQNFHEAVDFGKRRGENEMTFPLTFDPNRGSRTRASVTFYSQPSRPSLIIQTR